MTIIVGLDISTKTGIAVIDISDEAHGHPRILVAREITVPLTGMRRVVAIAAAVSAVVDDYKPTHIFIEGYGFANKHTLVPLVEIGTAIRLCLHKREYEPIPIPPTSVKLFTTGSGAAKKEAMMKAVKDRWHHTAPTDNVADAVAIAMFGACWYGSWFGDASLKAMLSVKNPKSKVRKKKLQPIAQTS